MAKNYGSDVSREQFEIIREDLEKAKKATRPRKVDLYDIFRAVLYILKTGSQWRNLPKDFPNWKLVYYYFTVWKKPKENGESLLEKVLKKLVQKIRIWQQKKVMMPEKILEIKRHIAVDSQGLPHAISVTTADITDRNGAIELLKINKNNLTDVKNVMADFGYSGKNFANEVHKTIGSKAEIITRNNVHKFSVIPKRWVVERTFVWFEKFRRLWKNCERLLLYRF